MSGHDTKCEKSFVMSVLQDGAFQSSLRVNSAKDCPDEVLDVEARHALTADAKFSVAIIQQAMSHLRAQARLSYACNSDMEAVGQGSQTEE